MDHDDDDDNISNNHQINASEPSLEEEPWAASKLLKASYNDLGSPKEVETRFLTHLERHCRADVRKLLQDSNNTSRDYSMQVGAFDLLQADPILGYLLLKYPTTLLPVLELAIVKAQQNELLRFEPDDETIKNWTIKGLTSSATTRVHARLVHLPPTCCKPSLGASISAQDVGKIWQVTGTVVRTGPVQMYESARTYQCCGCVTRNSSRRGNSNNNNESGGQNKAPHCGKTFLVHADLEQRNNTLAEPEMCPGTLPDGERCGGNKFKIVADGSVHTDYQEIKISADNNQMPGSLLIKLQHDLVDQCQPGDQVSVVGILLSQWHQSFLLDDMDCNVSLAMSAHSVRVIAENGDSWKKQQQHVGELEKYKQEFAEYWQEPKNAENPIAARDFITKAICPKLYGMQTVKLALLLTLIGGVSLSEEDTTAGEAFADGSFQWNEDGDHETQQNQIAAAAYYESRKPSTAKKVQTRRRNQSHILLVGDPGTGKSQFLRFAAALCPRSVLTTGVGTTSAGLTCAAVRDERSKEFALEAGALVLADKGVCCIDEFGCIRAADRTTIHEAMEQQTLSVAKAGIVCKLNCRATIVAVMNPRNCLYDNQASLSVNTGLGTPLLSRFDIIFKLVDSSDVDRDSNVATYLLNRAIRGAGYDVSNPSDEKRPIWTMDKLRAYISIVKETFQPKMSDAAALLLNRHYEKCRASESITIPVTVRFLESLIRLTQAHARLMYRSTAILDDAVAVIQVMECTAFSYGGFDGLGATDHRDILYRDPMTIGFSEKADLEFICFQYRLLQRYEMLEYMDNSKRGKAMANESSVDSQQEAWADVQAGVVSGSVCMRTEDHYGREHFLFTQPSKRQRNSNGHQ